MIARSVRSVALFGIAEAVCFWGAIGTDLLLLEVVECRRGWSLAGKRAWTLGVSRNDLKTGTLSISLFVACDRFMVGHRRVSCDPLLGLSENGLENQELLLWASCDSLQLVLM